MATTAPPAQRYRTLDIVRGVAVIGILVMNIQSFAMPSVGGINPLAWGGTSMTDLLTWFVEFVAFDGKMRGLFSLLFGASLLVVAGRGAENGHSLWRTQGPRLFWLLVLGAAHYTYLWDGDILMLYALTGVVALAFVRLSDRSLTRWTAGVLLFSVLYAALIGLGAWVAVDMSLSDGGQGGVFGPGSSETEGELALHLSGYAVLMTDRAGDAISSQLTQFAAYGPITLGLMLLGMTLVRNGLLLGEWPVKQARTLALQLAMLGGVPLAVLAAWLWATGFPADMMVAVYFGAATPFSLLLTAAWVAGLSAWASRSTGWLAGRLEATGRAAFTNYIGTSLVMTTIFYGYGGGLFGEVSRWQTLAFVALGAALMLAWSRPWLERFSYGPLEWVWRSLARGAPQPMARPALEPTTRSALEPR